MRVVALSRFRHLTIVRTATSIFIVVMLPPVGAAIAMSAPEPMFREQADSLLALNAQAAVMAWFFHALFLSIACLMSGRVKSAHDVVTANVLPDLMDTAPVSDSARFWGETVGTLRATAMIHLCCLPLLAAVAALSHLPTTMFMAIECASIALFFLASAGAAWQRRLPVTKYSSTRGARNAAAVAALLLLIILITTRAAAFRDSVVNFFTLRASTRAWREITATVDDPLLLTTLLLLLYIGTIAYYYRSSTRKRAWEN